MEAFLGKYQEEVSKTLKHCEKENIISRIWDHDHTIWKDTPTDIVNRLGWLHSPENMGSVLDDIEAFRDEVIKDGYTQVLLLGMGGSSLAPEMFAKVFGNQKNYCDLRILDSTDPDQILEMGSWAQAMKTLFIVSTKSGGTVETLSFMKYFYNEVANKEGSHFAAITDPGSKLQKMAKECGFRKIFLNDPDIGGEVFRSFIFWPCSRSAGGC